MNMEFGGYRPGAANEKRKTVVKEAMDSIGQHKLIERYQPEILGEGGVRVAFSLEKFPEYVGKVERRYLMHDTNHEVLENDLQEQRVNATLLREYFGSSVLRERIAIMKIPVTNELLKAINTKHDIARLPEGVHEIETVVSLQDRAPEAAFGPESFGIKTSYLERRPDFGSFSALSEYSKINARYIDGEPISEAKPGLRALADRMSDNTMELFKAATEDPELKAALVRFVETCMQFSRETGETVDFIGKNNIRVYKDDIGWRVLMIDAGLTGKMFAQGAEAIKKIANNRDVKRNDTATAINVLNYTRFINVLAEDLGMTDRLRFMNESMSPYNERVLAALADFSVRSQKSAEETYKLAAK